MIVGQFHTFKLVRVEWLEQCLIQQKRVDEDDYQPEYSLGENKKGMNEDEL